LNIRLYILKFLKWFPHQQFAWLALAVFFIGLFVSRAAMSIGMILLLGNAMINLNLCDYWRKFYRDKRSLALVFIFVLYALSWFWSDDKNHFASQLRVMTPFLVLPFAFHSIKWPQNWYDNLLHLFSALVLFGIAWSLYQYYQDFELVNQSYDFSKSLPTPFKNDHIRFGLGVAFAYGVQLYFIRKEGRTLWKLLHICMAIICLVYSFVLASKTGVLSITIYTLVFIFQLYSDGHKKSVMLLLIGAFIMPILLFQLLPTFKTKFNYTLYSFEKLLDGELENTSDGGRVLSYRLALDNIKANPFFGVGIGDNENAMKSAYKKNGISSSKILLPHNQFLLVMMNVGIIGFFLFLVAIGILFFNSFGQSYLMNSFLLSMLLAMMVEALWQSQYGVAIFLIFFLFLKHKKEDVGTIFTTHP